MPILRLAGGPLHYRAVGPAESPRPPVVFVHGLLVGATIWTRTAELLAERGVRSFLLDLPLGAHPVPFPAAADLSLTGVAGLVLDAMAALELRDVTLVGNDTGGGLCQVALDADSDRVAALVLTNCDAFEVFPPRPFDLLVAAGRSTAFLRAIATALRATRLRHSWLALGGLAHHLDRSVTRRWAEPLRLDASIRRDTAAVMRGLHAGDLREISGRMSAFDRPVRIVWGTDDRFFGIELARRLATVFPNADLVEVAGSRAFLPLDAPDRLADEIDAVTA